MSDYIIDDRMVIEQESDRFVDAIPEEERERILNLPHEEQLKAIDEYTKKLGFYLNDPPKMVHRSTEAEIEQAIADFKANKAKNQPNIAAIEKERDDAKKELQALKNQATLRSKGVRDEDLDYVQFKVDAMMKEDDKLDFDKAVSKFLKDNPRFSSAGSYRVKTGTDGSQGNGGAGADGNTSINNAIRRAAGYRV